ncbi:MULTISPECIES: protein phosphatase 2C domain-containing protein [Spirulina sp. CCY15215]|uniref:protein phosphatase 2C domain-containing protein n=1 Tax=Spirulina sp. CCY15215 TaxID=2767591 RepID=UPI00194ECA18|nr:protein phosphatase 2C domain-containing protein [Spirulina major]
MKGQYELAMGSIAGREHTRLGRNNQDALSVLSCDRFTIAVVCDGCGSGRHSEVGAKIGARLVVETLSNTLQDKAIAALQYPQFWQSIHQKILIQLQTYIKAMGGDWQQTLNDYFLFTIIGVLITPENTSIFSLGDGVILLNNCLTKLEFSGNAPPYISYGLKYLWEDRECPQEFQFQIHQSCETKELNTLLIGTDGVGDLINFGDRTLPGKLEKVGDIAQFWQDDSYFKNPDKVRRKLFLMNREVHHSGKPKEVGLLPDDTTFIVLRKI